MTLLLIINTAQDIVIIIAAIGGFLVSVATLVSSIKNGTTGKRIEQNTNGNTQMLIKANTESIHKDVLKDVATLHKDVIAKVEFKNDNDENKKESKA